MWHRNFVLVGISLAALGLVGPSAKAQLAAPPQRSSESASFLGVFLQEINGDRARALRLPEESGVEITRVDPNSPAATAGLMPGDVILQYNGQRVEGIEQFSRMVRETPAGREVRLQIFRNGAMQTVAAKVGSRPAAAVPQPFSPGPPSVLPRLSTLVRGATLGLETESIGGQLADYFGVKDGVLVRSVAANSPAEKAGIKAGDVITRVGDSHVATPAEIATQVRAKSGSPVALTVTRDRREMTVTVMAESGDAAHRF
jgi:serine protease Do